MKSLIFVMDAKGNLTGWTIYPPEFHCYRLETLGVMEGGGSRQPNHRKRKIVRSCRAFLKSANSLSRPISCFTKTRLIHGNSV